MKLEDGTVIEEIGMTVRDSLRIANNKSLSDSDRGLHNVAAKILVNGQTIVPEDLQDGFTTEEFEAITKFLFPDELAAAAESKEGKRKNA